jgi:hypothetical protein
VINGPEPALETVLDQLRECIFGTTLRPNSRWALRMAALALDTDGVSGRIVIEIPKRNTDPVDVNFTTGAERIVAIS